MIRFQRSPEERADPALFWQRADPAFFAAGACHILAFAARDRRPELAIRFLDPAPGYVGTHLYAVDGEWAFDFAGWHREQELLDVTEAAYVAAYPGWTADVSTIGDDVDLEAFCSDHLHRAPRYYAHDPRPRAEAYLARFPDHPPTGT